MKYFNPVVKGFYPDPSVCFANDTYYMVCSSFQYFPGVPLFESKDLVNWKQIGHVLTRKNQVMLEKINSSGGVFAPTIRFNNGRFYMVTTNSTTQQNFYVYTDDITKEWSDPIFVEQGGIDPSLFFENGRTYFISNGMDDNGVGGVIQCEIQVETGKKLTESRCIWNGTGGRFLESPHMYFINNNYYLMAAEGGTEYGHMITYARGESVWGPFKNYEKNPVLTNRNRAPFIIQGIGHGDLVKDSYGKYHILSLGFRQMYMWRPYHQLGREVFLTPVTFDKDGWFSAGTNGTTDESYEIDGDFSQDEKKSYSFTNTNWDVEWCYLRYPHLENYKLETDSAILTGSNVTLEEVDSPTFIGLRQRDFNGEVSVDLSYINDASESSEAGLTIYMDENEHYDIAIKQIKDKYFAILKFNIGSAKHLQTQIELQKKECKLLVRFENQAYSFYVVNDKEEIFLGKGDAKYLSSEVAEGFTGVIFALYALGKNQVKFTNFLCEYK